jgi:hypothetical protein
MELICQYDLLRLKSYQTVQKGIHFLNQDCLHAFCFYGLDYFNYSFKISRVPYSEKELNIINAFYKGHGIAKYKVLSPLLEENLLQAGFKIENSFVKQTLTTLNLFDDVGPTTFEIVNENNIDIFTETYLTSFEAKDKKLQEVINNFKQLLAHNSIKLFIMKDNGIAVGVIVKYTNNEKALLAGGAVLPNYRAKNYHKDGIKFRVNQLLLNPAIKEIETWTYANSQSNKNMLSCGFVNSETYYLYASN